MPVAQLLPLLLPLGILCGEGPSLRWVEAWGSLRLVPVGLNPGLTGGVNFRKSLDPFLYLCVNMCGPIFV